MEKVSIVEIEKIYTDRVILDVRTPAEYAQGHLPNAISFPLFTDEERVQVGTLYKQVSANHAFLKGLEFVGTKLANFVRQAQKIAPQKRVSVHCWRGGKRSSSMGWLLETAGFDVVTIVGGYKAYRTLVAQSFESKPLKIMILGGKTGCGKTLILKQLREAGEQIIDLEGLAHHKGSAFGWIGELPQPTVEQFENNLFDVFRQLDPNRRVWVENESRTIGSAVIPAGFWAQMRGATLVHLEVPNEARIKHLVAIYTQTNVAELILSFEKIQKKLGQEALKSAIEALNQGDFETATRVALKYYDKIYMQLFDNNTIIQKFILDVSNATPNVAARQLIDWANQYFKN
ncbi:MAG: hypothetical protein RIS64_3751 [Bacteroidota bacterium]|jgi:tRNA 2-selenouridine synthase